MTIYQSGMKRVVDLSCALLALVVLAPVMLLVALCVRIIMGAPVLFRQERPGLNGRSFLCLKFRTMTNQRDSNGDLLSERKRLVPLGAWLRRTSLDELPQLWNVVRGDISLVGPRPLLKEFLPYYTPEEQRRHTVRPGITGWAQVHGRNNLSFDERLQMDVWYVERISWHLDLRILLSTVAMVCSAKGTELISYPLLHEQRRLQLQFPNSGVPAGSSSSVDRTQE